MGFEMPDKRIEDEGSYGAVSVGNPLGAFPVVAETEDEYYSKLVRDNGDHWAICLIMPDKDHDLAGDYLEPTDGYYQSVQLEKSLFTRDAAVRIVRKLQCAFFLLAVARLCVCPVIDVDEERKAAHKFENYQDAQNYHDERHERARRQTCEDFSKLWVHQE